MTRRRAPTWWTPHTAVIGALMAALAAACSGAPILANPVAPLPSRPVATSPAAAPIDPQPIELPRDDAPHDRLTEWWYYTGHLRSADGRRYGFEYVIFRAERGAFPTSWVSHLAITDEPNDRFLYSQRLEVGPGVDQGRRRLERRATPTGFDLAISGFDPTQAAAPPRPPWTMTGADGRDTPRRHPVAG